MMLSQLPDLYQVVNASPSDTTITQRRTSISALMAQFEDKALLYGCIELAILGYDVGSDQPPPTACAPVVAAIQGQQPSFPNDPKAHPLDLQVCSGIAVAEHIAASHELVSAYLIRSALGCRPPRGEGHHLAKFLAALSSAADNALRAAAAAERERGAIEVANVPAGEGAALIKNVNKVLEDFARNVRKNVASDQEELQVLWWVFGNRSNSLQAPYDALDLPARTMAAGNDLSGLVMLPPRDDSTQFLRAVLKDDRRLQLAHLIQASPLPLLKSICAHVAQVETLVRSHPALMPLYWLCARRLDSNLAPGWESEFSQKTKLSPTLEMTATEWSSQLFWECVAARHFAND